MNSLISVLMSAYNNEATVEAAVKSILNQTYKNFELIIIDDASTDKTFSILENLAKQDARIKLFKNIKNLGLAACLNRALYESKGEFVARQDAHATSLPTRFEKQVDFLKTHPEIGVLGTATPSYTPPATTDAEIKQFLKRKNIMVHGSIMARTNIIKNIGGYNRNYRYVQDFVLWRKLALQGIRFANLPAGQAGLTEPLYVLNTTTKNARVTAQKLLYLMNALENNDAIASLSHLPLTRQLQFLRYLLRYFIKRFLHI